jgi:anti-sigma factor (TIGR02949 family)
MADEIKNCGELDERLTPYVDGEASPDARRAVDGHLAACPPCKHTAAAEAAAREAVREHRTALTARAPESLRTRCASLQSTIANSQSSIATRQSRMLRRWAPLSLAATIVLAVAGVFVFGLNDRVEALAASLAVDHVKCFKVSGSAGHVDAPVAEKKWLADQGWAVVVPPASPAEQLRLVDVRRCFSTDGRAAHMMYSWRGAPVSLYVLPENLGRDQVIQKVGQQAVIWCANNRTYAVVAEGQPKDLTPIVTYMKAHVR